jgi:hypothetical protein
MRGDIVKRGLIGFIIGIVLAGFGWADINYFLTQLPLEVNVWMVNIGSILALVGLGYFIYGLIKSPVPTYPAYTPQPTAPIPPPSSYPAPTSTNPSISLNSNLPPPPPTQRPKFCTHCGQAISADIKFCGSCGTQVA